MLNIITYLFAKNAAENYTDINTSGLAFYSPVVGSGVEGDTFVCNINSNKEISFALTIADADVKTITFTNVPAGRCEVFLEITTSAVASIIWTLNGGTIAWSKETGAPSMVSGKIYRIFFLTNDGGATWDAFASVGL